MKELLVRIVGEMNDPERTEYHAAYTDHDASSSCWCHPYLEYRCPWNGNEVWKHNRCEA